MPSLLSAFRAGVGLAVVRNAICAASVPRYSAFFRRAVFNCRYIVDRDSIAEASGDEKRKEGKEGDGGGDKEAMRVYDL